MSLTKNVVLNLYSSMKCFFRKIQTFFQHRKWTLKVRFLHFFGFFDHLVKVQLGRYQKNISQEWSRVKNLLCVSCAAGDVFPVKLLLLGPKVSTQFFVPILEKFWIFLFHCQLSCIFFHYFIMIYYNYIRWSH